jgi:hypothetical protein
VFTARYALSPYVKQIRFVFKGLKWAWNSVESVLELFRTSVHPSFCKPEATPEKVIHFRGILHSKYSLKYALTFQRLRCKYFATWSSVFRWGVPHVLEGRNAFVFSAKQYLDCLTLKINALRSSAMSGTPRPRQCNITEYLNPQQHRCEKLRSRNWILV